MCEFPQSLSELLHGHQDERLQNYKSMILRYPSNQKQEKR